MKDWDWSKNNALGISPEHVSEHSHKKVNWKCNKCTHEWQAIIDSRSSGRGCPRCNIRNSTSYPEQYIYNWLKYSIGDIENRYKVNGIELDIFSTKHKFAIEYNGLAWHKDKKSKLNICNDMGIYLIDINEVHSNEIKIVDKHTIEYGVTKSNYTQRVKNSIEELCCRVAEIIQSEYCVEINRANIDIDAKAIESKGDIPDNRSILILGEDIVKEYNAANNKIKAKLIWAGSSENVNWKCKKCGYIFSASPLNRKRGDGCPVCSNHIVCAGINDLVTKRPLIASELKEGFNGSKYLEYDNRIVEWVCNNCGATWESRVQDRTRLYMGCRNCKYILNDIDYDSEYIISKATTKFDVEYISILGKKSYSWQEALFSMIKLIVKDKEPIPEYMEEYISITHWFSGRDGIIETENGRIYVNAKILKSKHKMMQSISSLASKYGVEAENIKVKYKKG